MLLNIFAHRPFADGVGIYWTSSCSVPDQCSAELCLVDDKAKARK